MDTIRHSNVPKWLLDRDANHGQESSFLELLLAQNCSDHELPNLSFHDYSVERESENEVERFDLLLKAEERFSVKSSDSNREDGHLEEVLYRKTIILREEITDKSLSELKDKIDAYFESELEIDLEKSKQIIGRLMDSIRSEDKQDHAGTEQGVDPSSILLKLNPRNGYLQIIKSRRSCNRVMTSRFRVISRGEVEVSLGICVKIYQIHESSR